MINNKNTNNNQPLMQGKSEKEVANLGFLKIIDKQGNTLTTIFKPLKISLLIGEQFIHDYKHIGGFGLNHIYYKHFKDIPERFHIFKDKKLDYKETILNFLSSFLNNTNNLLEISVNKEEPEKPILIRRNYGRLVLKRKNNLYSIVTFVPSDKPVGTLLGFYKNDTKS